MKTLIGSLLATVCALSSWAQTSFVELAWEPVVVPASQVTNLAYRVYWTPTNILALKTQETLTNGIVVTNLSPGTSYTLYVTAFWLSSKAESLPSEVVTYRTPDVVVTTPPFPPPTDLSLLNLSLYPGNAYRVQLTFTATVPTNVVKYRITAKSASYTSVVETLTKSATLALTNEIPYEITAAAVDVDGNQSVSASIPFRNSIATNWAGTLRTKTYTVNIGPQ